MLICLKLILHNAVRLIPKQFRKAPANSMFLYTPFYYFYFPKHTRLFDPLSRLILDYKDNDPFAFDFFTACLSDWIKNNIKHKIWICAIPSSRKKTNSITRSAEIISSSIPSVKNGNHFIIQIKKRKSFCKSGKRNPLVLIKSIQFSNDISGKNILLVDDIITTGTTMYTLKNELLMRGAKSVKTFALFKSFENYY